jgi:hypothetical protein
VAHVLKPGNLNGVDQEIRPRQQVLAFRRTFDVPVLACGLDQLLGYPVRQLEAFCVNVHEREGTTSETLYGEYVGDYLPRKDRTASSDYGHLCHAITSSKRPDHRRLMNR